MRNLVAWMFLLLLSAAGVTAGCSTQPQPTSPSVPEQKRDVLVIAGSGSNIAVTKKLVEVFSENQKIHIEVPDSIGSGGGITGVMNGQIDLGITSRSLTAAEKASGLQEIPYARAALAVAVGPDVPDEDVSYEDLVKIYQGSKNTWSNGAPIIVFLMYEKDSTNEVLSREIPGFKETLADCLRENRWQVFYNQQSQEQAVEKTPHAIGFINMPAVVDAKLKILKVNGVTPSSENVLNGSYRLYKTLNYVYREPLKQDISAFIDFTFSQRGKKILLDSQCIPLNK